MLSGYTTSDLISLLDITRPGSCLTVNQTTGIISAVSQHPKY